LSNQVTYIDLLGLLNDKLYTPIATIKIYAQELGLQGIALETQKERLTVLSRLVGGAGVTVVTGPSGAPFWSLASIEVKVRVEPDGYEYSERTTDKIEWALRSLGVDIPTAKVLAHKPPTSRAKSYAVFTKGLLLVEELDSLPTAQAIVNSAFTAEIVRDTAEQYNLLDRLPRNELIALDWEWDHRVQGNPPLGLNVSTRDRNYYLPVTASDYTSSSIHADTLRAKAGSLVETGWTVFHNGKTDLQTQYPGNPMWLSGKPIEDTMVMAYLLGHTVLDLKNLTRERLNRDPMERPDDLRSLPLSTMARYGAAGDTRNTYDLYHDLQKGLEDTGQWGVYSKIERPVSPVISAMELYGTPVSGPELEILRQSLLQTEHEYVTNFLMSDGLDISDDDQAKELVRRRIGYNIGSLRKEVLASLQTEWAFEVLRYRQTRHRRRSFVDKHLGRWYAEGRPVDFRAFSNFNQAGEALRGDGRSFRRAPRTGRLSSSGDFGNLQNQPRTIRSAFVPPADGYVWWSLDYSGLELRLAAAISGDREMLRVLTEQCPTPNALGLCEHRPKHGDLHDSFLYRIISLTGTNPGRTVAKNGNFEQLYGGGPDKLVTILSLEESYLPLSTAKLVVDTHRETYHEYHSYRGLVVDTARQNGGYSESLYHRRRTEADLFSVDSNSQSWAERALVNMTIQGSAADILKMAMGYAVPILKHYDAHMSLQVHDELCGWVPKDNAESFIRDMKRMMESIQIPNLRLVVEGGVGSSWADVKG
jgi:DNA polymerase I-like protein with 3'-5' exonuclease and polymerase domains